MEMPERSLPLSAKFRRKVRGTRAGARTFKGVIAAMLRRTRAPDNGLDVISRLAIPPLKKTKFALNFYAFAAAARVII